MKIEAVVSSHFMLFSNMNVTVFRIKMELELAQTTGGTRRGSWR